MAKRDFIATYSDTHVTLTIKRKAAERVAVLINDAGDWFGNMEPEEMGMTSKQLIAAEDDVFRLADLLLGIATDQEIVE